MWYGNIHFKKTSRCSTFTAYLPSWTLKHIVIGVLLSTAWRRRWNKATWRRWRNCWHLSSGGPANRKWSIRLRFRPRRRWCTGSSSRPSKSTFTGSSTMFVGTMPWLVSWNSKTSSWHRSWALSITKRSKSYSSLYYDCGRYSIFDFMAWIVSVGQKRRWIMFS